MSFLDDAPIVIAEIGGNHGGSLDLAKEMVSAAVEAGTPYVKFQTYQAERLVGRDHPAFDAFVEEGFSFDQFRELKSYCDTVGAVFLSTPFDPESADLLEGLAVPAYKIASGDLTYTSLISHVARFGKPILLSTGVSTWDDVDRAVAEVSKTDTPVILLHCVAAYPCADEEMDLMVIQSLADRYDRPVGFSDHTRGIEMALASVALGAVVIEKHFTTDTSLPGGDNDLSITPDELSVLVKGVSRIYGSLGDGEKKKTVTEMNIDPRIHRSLIFAKDMKAGDTIGGDDLDAVRPAVGIPPWQMEDVIGRKLKRTAQRGERVALDSLA